MPADWVDSAGRNFVLSEARLTLGNLYFHEPADVHVARWRPLDLLVPTAVAHPGHDDSGDVAGER